MHRAVVAPAQPPHVERLGVVVVVGVDIQIATDLAGLALQFTGGVSCLPLLRVDRSRWARVGVPDVVPTLLLTLPLGVAGAPIPLDHVGAVLALPALSAFTGSRSHG